MLVEAVVAAIVGLASLFLVLQPLFLTRDTSARPAEPLDPEETPRGVAVAALKEIDFDRETGKLSEEDYQFLKTKYTAIALEAIRAEKDGGSPESAEVMVAERVRALRVGPTERVRCPICGPRPEPDAAYCSSCGVELSPTASTASFRLTGPNQAPAPIQ
jgi:hypothetical protein